MKRVVGYVLGLALLLLVVFAPAAFWNLGGRGDALEPTSITSYVARFTVDEEGDLAVVEQLTVDFPVFDRHGIFRFWDQADPSAPHARRVPHDISVTMDGHDVPVELLTESHGRYRVAKIGSPDYTVDYGEHRYVLRYRIDGVLEPGTDTETRFYWNLVPGGWRQRIEATDLTVRLPVEPDGVRCALGAGETGGCTAKPRGPRTLHVATGGLEPDTPVTLLVGLDMPTPPPGEERPWSARFDPVLGSNLPVLWLVVLLAVLAGALGFRVASRAREPRPQYPLMYAPPDDLGPAQAAYLLTERVSRQAYVASLMQAAEKGAVELRRDEDTWTVADRNGAAGWAGLDAVTRTVAHLLGGPGTTFVARRRDVAAGERLKSEIAMFEQATRAWARNAGHMVPSGLGGAGGALVLGCLGVTVALVAWNPFDMSLAAAVVGAFGVGAAPLLAPGSGTRRTASGRQLWSRVGGFHRVLSTPSSEQRFDFSGRQELYTAYIPWAVALGCAEEWAAKYRTETGTEPPVPSYLGGAWVGSHVGGVGTMVDDFSSTVDSAISSYQATQRSSSSGGGGFSGGGGGGGGGGGSW